MRSICCRRLLAGALILFFTTHVLGQGRPADLILINGNIRTLDADRPRAEAVAISGGKITAVGSTAEIRKLAGKQTRVINAEGRLVLPGFNDAHVHFASVGNRFSSIDLTGARSPEEIAAKLAEYVRFLPKGRWILGRGFDTAAVGASGQLRRLADAVTPDNPVFVYSADAKSAFANGAALAAARITRKTADPRNGVIGRDGSGEPDGMLTGTAIRLVGALVPADHTRRWAEVVETATDYAASLGVTSVQDMHSDELADFYRELDRAGKLKTRVYDCSPISAIPRFAAGGIKAASGDAMVRTGCIKYFMEGDEAEIPALRRSIAAADKAGLQVMIHAIGPRANTLVLDAFEWAAKANGPRDRRFRVEHAHGARAEDVPRFARSSIIPSMQPWLFRRSGAAIFARHLKLGTSLAFGSDAMMVDLNPLLGIQAAASGPDGISVEDAVRAYTVGSAYAEFQEKVKGRIRAGQLADLVILSDDIFKSEPSMIADARVVVTILNGEVVYSAPHFAEQ
ncbi:MAG: amidohydrolase [Pyrinomonadaceae bacterium]